MESTVSFLVNASGKLLMLETGCGKTQLSHTISVIAQLPRVSQKIIILCITIVNIL
jgi:hypothetical protein